MTDSAKKMSTLDVGVDRLKLFYNFCKLRLKIENRDHDWEYTEEPHASRRKAILKKHPEIKKLMGYDPMIAVFVTTKVILQMAMCYLIQDASWPVLLVAAYCIGGCLNHSLGSAIHEIGHNLAFGHSRASWNRALGMFCNLPMGIPISITYKKYHTDHHRYLGHEDMDVDIPTVLESNFFNHPLLRALWLFIHPLLHGIRPFYKSPLPITTLELVNVVVQLSFDYLIYVVFGYKALLYLVIGTLLALGFHPLAGHFISEHYLFKDKHQATYSYYGPLNFLVYNVGYHVEHHDFPYIPCTRLPQVRKIAPEFYDHLPYHTSWLKVLWNFIMDPTMGPQSHGVGYTTPLSDSDLGWEVYGCGSDSNQNGMNKNAHNGATNGSNVNGNHKIPKGEKIL